MYHVVCRTLYKNSKISVGKIQENIIHTYILVCTYTTQLADSIKSVLIFVGDSRCWGGKVHLFVGHAQNSPEEKWVSIPSKNKKGIMMVLK